MTAVLGCYHLSKYCIDHLASKSVFILPLDFLIFGRWSKNVAFERALSLGEGKTVHVVIEITEAHEGCGALVLRDEGADTARVATRACVEQATELVVGDLVSLASGLTEVFLHVKGHLELKLDDLDQNLLRHAAFLVGLAAEGDEGLQVLVEIVLLLGLQVLHLGESKCTDHDLECKALNLLFLVDMYLDLFYPFLGKTVSAGYARVRRVLSLTFENHWQFEAFNDHSFRLLLLVEPKVLFEAFFLKLAQGDFIAGHFFLLFLFLAECRRHDLLLLSDKGLG